MPNLFSGINLALRAMLAHQQMLEVIEHNVANANTPGYRRQEAMLEATVPYPAPSIYGGIGPGQFGTGVAIEKIRRFNLEFFDGRYRRELSEASRWSTESDVLRQVEATLSESGEDGLVGKLDAFWGGWQALSSDPANMAVRADLLQRAEDLAEGLNWRAQSLINLRKDQDLAVSTRVEEINTLAEQVARLNVEIANVQGTGDQPNDLLDERDRVINRLSEIAGAAATVNENGEAVVSIGGHALVVGSSTFTLTAAANPANDNLVDVTWAADGRALNLSRGELQGLLQARDTIIPKQLDGLNTLAFELATRVNAVHQTGYGLNDATGLNFFADFTSSDYALEISLSSDMDDPANVAAASQAGAPGDGSNAVTLAGFRDQLFLGGGTLTLNAFYTQQVSDLGLEINGAQQKAADRGVVVDAMDGLRESVSGVNLDEEAARMVQSQRAYQAAVRMMTVMDEMLDRVINGMGIVGR